MVMSGTFPYEAFMKERFCKPATFLVPFELAMKTGFLPDHLPLLCHWHNRCLRPYKRVHQNQDKGNPETANKEKQKCCGQYWWCF